MAITFNGSSTYIESALAVTHPMTLACWAYSTSLTVAQALIAVGVAGGTHRNVLFMSGHIGGDPVQASTQGTATSGASTTTGYTANTWHHCAATFSSSASRAAFIDGGSKGTDVGTTGATGFDSVLLGARYSTTRGLFFVGKMAEAAVWSDTLTDAEIASLAKGLCPLKVRPQSLVIYAPLVRELSDLKGGTLTSASTSVGDHTRVYR